MPQPELKNCPVPWCGKILRPSIQHYPLDKHVLCPTCLTEGPKKLTEAEAVTAWNSRPQSEVEIAAKFWRIVWQAVN